MLHFAWCYIGLVVDMLNLNNVIMKCNKSSGSVIRSACNRSRMIAIFSIQQLTLIA